MNITRHNYETFFLLYVDNELSVAERNAVEVFVQENTDLKAELQLLQQTVFNAGDIFFENKTSLLKDENASLKENLLLYLDNELPAADILNTQQLLVTDVVVQKEFALLQKTKLQTDTVIIFPDKKSLYRKEEGRVVGFAWWRVAAAAILLVFGTLVTVVVINNKNSNTGTEVAGTTGTKKDRPSTPTTLNTISTPGQVIPQRNTAVINTTKQKNNLPVQKIMPQDLQKDNGNTIVVKKDDNKKPGNNLPQPLYNNFNKDQRNKTEIAIVPQSNKAIEKVNSGIAVPVALPNSTNADNGYALNTKFTQINADEPNNDGVLNINENNSKKSRLGGFLRKVKRIVERNTNIKTGNGIKVAAFDIAIK